MRRVLTLCIGICCGLHGLTMADEIIVNWDGPGDFTTIQAAIDDINTDNGDVIIVYPGSYRENINLSGKAITLRSTDPTNPEIVLITRIEGSGYAGINCFNGEGPDTVINGFFITPQHGVNLDSCMQNYEASPTVINCTFSNNTSLLGGGGMDNYRAAPTVINCTFSNNTSESSGGGMANFESSPTLIDCTFRGNSAREDGGGIYNQDSTPTITGCRFDGNSAEYDGGGIFNVSTSATIRNCTLINNTASQNGGGISNLHSTSIDISGCSFSGNTAQINGGGIYNENIWFDINVTNGVFENNSAPHGGGLYNMQTAPLVSNCIFSNNTADDNGGGMVNITGSDSIITSCQFYGNSAVNGSAMYNDLYCCITLTDSVICQNTPEQIEGWGAFCNGVQGNAISDNDCVFLRPAASALFGDSDNDGDVDLVDFAAFAENWLVGTE